MKYKMLTNFKKILSKAAIRILVMENVSPIVKYNLENNHLYMVLVKYYREILEIFESFYLYSLIPRLSGRGEGGGGKSLVATFLLRLHAMTQYCDTILPTSLYLWKIYSLFSYYLNWKPVSSIKMAPPTRVPHPLRVQRY